MRIPAIQHRGAIEESYPLDLVRLEFSLWIGKVAFQKDGALSERIDTRHKQGMQYTQVIVRFIKQDQAMTSWLTPDAYRLLSLAV